MKVVQRFTSKSESCEYLPEESSNLLYEVVPQITPGQYEERMNQGWRKFGVFLFRPVCAGCQACRPIRIPVDRFKPDRSQRRAFQRNTDLTVRYGLPGCDEARMDLYARYHQSQTSRKGWSEHDRDEEDYKMQFVHNPLASVEISVWEGEQLRAVALTDVTPSVVSGIYHYHDPDLRERSLGTFVILHIIALAHRLGKPYVHLGYYVAGCGSLCYKSRFRPCEIMGVDGEWYEYE